MKLRTQNQTEKKNVRNLFIFINYNILVSRLIRNMKKRAAALENIDATFMYMIWNNGQVCTGNIKLSPI